MRKTPNRAAAAPLAAQPLLEKAEGFRALLREWYEKNHRPLPWRTDPSLYRTVVSEFMLQQTRIDTALPYFDRWMAALPGLSDLAAASEETVVKLWEGLGYYRRARNLHRLAKILVTLPEVPRTPEAWRELPGIGAYSAAAITSIAFGARAACVDGNVVRVLSRLSGYREPLKDSSSAARLFQPMADELLDPADPATHNQAMMELGATACQRKPICAACPLATFCEARRRGLQEAIPAFPPRKIEKVEVVRVWCRRDDDLLVCRSASSARRLSDLCELPTAEEFGCPPERLAAEGELKLRKQRSITRYSITESIYALQGLLPPHPLAENLFWAKREELNHLTFSGPHRRWINEILGRRE